MSAGQVDCTSLSADRRPKIATGQQLPLSFICLTLIFVLYPLFLLSWLKGMVILTTASFVVIVMTDVIINRRSLFFTNRVGVILLFYMLPMISFAWSKTPADTFFRSIIPAVNFAIFYISLHASKYGREEIIGKISIIVPMYFCFISVCIFSIFGSFRNSSREMAELLGSYSNHSTSIVLMCLPFLIVLASRVGFGLNLPTISIISCILTTILSQSRAGIVILLGVLIFFPVFIGGSRIHGLKRLVGILAISAPVTVLVIVGAGFENTIGGVAQRTASSQVGEALLGDGLDYREADLARAAMYVFGIEMIIEHPIVGTGFGGLYHFMLERIAFGVVSHNLIITFWGELGLIGMVVLLYFFFRITLDAYQLRTVQFDLPIEKLMPAACLCCILVFVVYGMVRPFYSNYMFPVMLGYLVHALAERKKLFAANPHRHEL